MLNIVSWELGVLSWFLVSRQCLWQACSGGLISTSCCGCILKFCRIITRLPLV